MRKPTTLLALIAIAMISSTLIRGELKNESTHTGKLESETGRQEASLERIMNPRSGSLQQSAATMSNAAAQSQSQQQTPVPQQAIFRELFYQVRFIQRRAEDLERRGQDASEAHTYYKRRLNLTDKQNESLNRIASDLDRALTQLDKQARAVIVAFRRDHLTGQLKPGENPPPPPDEMNFARSKLRGIKPKAIRIYIRSKLRGIRPDRE